MRAPWVVLLLLVARWAALKLGFDLPRVEAADDAFQSLLLIGWFSYMALASRLEEVERRLEQAEAMSARGARHKT